MSNSSTPASLRTARQAEHHASQRLRGPTRALLAAFSLLTALGVAALAVGAERTDEAFAWTVAPPAAAAFLGAAYGSGCVLVLLTLRAGEWPQARWPLATILLFAVVTLVATLLHLDRLHLPGKTALATSAAWFWLAVYVVLPPLMAAVMVHEHRHHRSTHANRPSSAAAARAPRTFAASLVVQAALLTVAGLLLLPGTGQVAGSWPWPLTPLMAQVTAAWLLAFGLAALLASREPPALLGPAAAGYAAFGALELLVLVLHRDDLRPGAATAAYVVVAAWVLATGLWGARLARVAPRGGADR